ncbi:MAG: peroxiredoxin family protein [Actinomycetota bacterium]|nr:peroxiredoxin family protein [Actinomycetota bacterium]
MTDAGARVVGISVDDPSKNAAMVEKLKLPFPLLSDPNGQQAIKPYDVWHEGESYARPALVIVSPQGEEVFRQVGGEFSDRLSEPELVEKLRELQQGGQLGRGSVQQPPPRDLVQPDPSEGAFPASAMGPYFKGARFAAIAMGMRAPEAKDAADSFREQVERYHEASKRAEA